MDFRRSAVCLIACTGIAGCSDEAPVGDRGGGQVDTLGIPWVDHLETARMDGHEEGLVPVGETAVSADGRLAFAQSQVRQVRVLSGEGRPLFTVGAPGDGPGEFRAISRVGFLSDTLWVFDGRLSRITLFDSGGKLLSTSRISTEAFPAGDDRRRLPEFPVVLPLALAAPDRVIAELSLFVGQEVRGDFEDVVTLAVLDREGTIRTIIGYVPRGLTQLDLPEGSISIPFAYRHLVAASPSGDHVAVAEATPQSLASGRFRVRSIDVSGVTRFQMDIPYSPVPLPTEVVDSVLTQRVAGTRQRAPALARALEEKYTPPDFYPPLRNLVVGTDGSVWVGTMVDRATIRYLIIREDGRLAGRLELPLDSVRVVSAGPRFAWVVEDDEWGVESVVRWQLAW